MIDPDNAPSRRCMGAWRSLSSSEAQRQGGERCPRNRRCGARCPSSSMLKQQVAERSDSAGKVPAQGGVGPRMSLQQVTREVQNAPGLVWRRLVDSKFIDCDTVAALCCTPPLRPETPPSEPPAADISGVVVRCLASSSSRSLGGARAPSGARAGSLSERCQRCVEWHFRG